MTPARSGSAILLCLALAAFAAMVGYAFLRGAARQEMSGKSELLVALAQDAAQSGLAHATEQILLDYNARSLDLAAGSGAVTLTPAPMHLDGPYRAPFVSFVNPNRLAYAGVIESDDVSEENHQMATLIRKGEFSYAWWHDFQGGYLNQGGGMIADARGRYIEVNYHNSTRPSPVAANPVPVATTRFMDPAAAKPERAKGLFLDENLRRLTTGTVEDQRRKARYRLRYAVNVEDLNAHLLTNPRADMNIDWKDPNNDYRVIPRWVDHAGYVLENMTVPWGNRATGLRFNHLFRGRGNSGNADRAPSTSASPGLPATFPMMYRMGQPADTVQPWYGVFNYDNNGTSRQGGQLFSFDNTKFPSYPSIVANPAGGDILTPVGQSEYRPYAHALVGPQYSWFNQVFSLQGTGIPISGHQDGQSVDYGNWSSQWSRISTIYTLFGRSQLASAKPPADWKWYEGNVDTPWQINLLTAPPQVISEMLLAYLPPHLKAQHWTHESSYKKIGTNPDGTPIWDAEDMSKRKDNGGYGWSSTPAGLDILNDGLGDGFSEFPAPYRDKNANGVFDAGDIKPDYYQAPREPRPADQRYPGPLCRGDADTAARDDYGAIDKLGKDIDVDSAMGVTDALVAGWCTHTYNPLLFWWAGGSSPSWEWDELPSPPPVPVPPWPTTPRWLTIRHLDPLKILYKHSYFWDMTYAMTTTLSYAKATWVQYPNPVFEPRNTGGQKGFASVALRDPLAYDTIEEIDALFLRQLGENYHAPGTPCPQAPIYTRWAKEWAKSDKITFDVSPDPVSNTIKSLVTKKLIDLPSVATSLERGKVMERILNDYRMSFFGSSPKYADFRPMDFDGNGKVTCSAYQPNPAATPDEKTFKTDRWQPVDGGAGGAGRGPKPVNWFSATGTFYIGKSHFFRVLTRGEVFDNLLRKPVAQQDLETVLVVDPEAPQFPPAGRISTEQRALFKQWRYNDSVVELPLQSR